MGIRDYEHKWDIRLTTDRVVEIMEKTNVLWKEFAEALKKFNEAKKRRTSK